MNPEAPNPERPPIAPKDAPASEPLLQRTVQTDQNEESASIGCGVVVLSFFLVLIAALLTLFAGLVYSQAPWKSAGMVGGSATVLLLLGWAARTSAAMIFPTTAGLVLAAILGLESMVMTARYLQGSKACHELRPRTSTAPVPEPSLRVEFLAEGNPRFCVGSCVAQYSYPETARRLLQGGLTRVELPFEGGPQDSGKPVHWRFEIKAGGDPACHGATKPKHWERESGPYVFETGLTPSGSCMVGARADNTTAALVLRELLTQEPGASNPITTLRQSLVVARTGEVIGFAGAANSGSHVEGSARPTIVCSNKADTLRLLEKAGVKPQSAWGEHVDRRDSHQPARFFLTAGAKRTITTPIAPPELLHPGQNVSAPKL